MKIKLTGGRLFLSAVLFLATGQSGWAGACLSARFHDNKDLGCNRSAGGAGAPASGAAGVGNQAVCKDCPPVPGMPRWWINEPYINLHVSDLPLTYKTSSGQDMDFRFFYRQRAKMPDTDEVPNYYTPHRAWASWPVAQPTCGTNAAWGHNWNMSVVFWDTTWESQWSLSGSLPNYLHRPYSSPALPPYQSFEALVFQPQGGVSYFSFTNQMDASGATLQRVSAGGFYATQPTPDTNGIYWGNPSIGFKLVYPDGSQDVFGLVDRSLYLNGLAYYDSRTYVDSSAKARLTRRIDPQGRITSIGYEFTNYPGNSLSSQFRVHYVVDPDGHTNTFLYNSAPSSTAQWLLSEIDDPFGRKATFGYNGGMLNSITDSAGLPSSFQYDSSTVLVPQYCRVYNPITGVYDTIICGSNSVAVSGGWMTQMTTPYGVTRFSFYQNPDPVDNGFQQRAAYVSEPGGASQFYCYLHQSSVATSATAPAVPGQSLFDDGLSGGNHPGLNYRNTFHWGPRQFDGLSAGVKYYLQNGALASALGALTTADLNKAQLRHWPWQADGFSISTQLSSEREPSPDLQGTIQGQRTWYNYLGKSSAEMEGAFPLITCIARVLPDGTSQYTRYNYYSSRLVSDNATSYTKPDGSIGEVSNWFQYAANNVDLLSVSNSAGQFERYAYNSLHQITNAANALNYVTALGWDNSTHNLTSVALPTGQTIGLTYCSQTLVSQISVAPNGLTIAIPSYTNNLPQIVQISGTGLPDLWVTNTWDGLNRPTSTSYQDGSFTSNRFDKLDLSATRDRLGNWTYFGHDEQQHLTAVTNASNAVTTYSWCGCGGLTGIIDALTNITTLNYNNQGLLTNVLFPDASSLTYAFDLAGRRTSVKDGLGRGRNYGYNNQDLVTTVSNAYGLVSRTVYDLVNRPVSRTDANGVTVTNQFDLINRLTARIWQGGSGGGALAASETYGYTTNGLIAHTNRDNQVTRYARDGAGRVVAETNANLEVTQFGYDAASHLISLLDGLNHATAWHYNQYGLLTNKVDGLSREILRYTYNSNGQLTNRWMLGSGNTAYTFDAVGNLKSINYGGTSYTSPISFSYDALNRLTNMVDASGTTTFSHTPTGQLQSEDGPWSNDTETYGYTQGLRTSLALNSQPSTLNFTYGYDSALRLTSLTSPAGGFLYGYNVGQSVSAGSLVKAISLPNGASITNHFDSLARLDYTALLNHWGHPLDGYAYQMDTLGLRTNVMRDFGLTTNSASAGYDNVGQLTSWTAKELSGTPRLNEQLGWAYDKAHNLRYRTNNALVQTFTNNAVNELTNITRTGTLTLSGAIPAPMFSVTVNGQAAQTYGDYTFAAANLTLANGQNSFTNIAQNPFSVKATNTVTVNLPGSNALQFDLNGNLTNDGTKAFFYDAENQLTNVMVAGQWKTEFVYDGLNRRRIARDYSWDGVKWINTNEVRYVYDRMLAVQERDASGNVLVTYTRGLDLSGSRQGAGGIGGLLARTDASGSAFYHADGNGNVTALMDGYENMVARYLYNPYGKLVGQWGTLANANVMRFSSMPVHRLSGMPHYPFRDYEPNLQQFLSADPIGERGGINLYGFVGNNPISNVDPLGLEGNPVSSTLPDAGGSWSSDPNGPGSSFYDPGYSYTPPAPNDVGNAWVQGFFDGLTGGYNIYGEKMFSDDTMIGAIPDWLGGPGGLGALGKAEKLCEKVAKGKPFSKATKDLAKKLNRERNGGVLKSEKSGQELVPGQQHTKGVRPPDNEAQVDHVIPKAQGGDNSIGNSQILSRKENIEKSDN